MCWPRRLLFMAMTAACLVEWLALAPRAEMPLLSTVVLIRRWILSWLW